MYGHKLWLIHRGKLLEHSLMHSSKWLPDPNCFTLVDPLDFKLLHWSMSVWTPKAWKPFRSWEPSESIHCGQGLGYSQESHPLWDHKKHTTSMPPKRDKNLGWSPADPWTDLDLFFQVTTLALSLSQIRGLIIFFFMSSLYTYLFLRYDDLFL